LLERPTEMNFSTHPVLTNIGFAASHSDC